MTETKYIFVTGGVLSGIGKGITCASIGTLIKSLNMGTVTIKKLDPYLNIDPGTMNPLEHGEVFVTDDGQETDLDLGHYERFLDQNMSRLNSTSAGRLMFYEILQKEREGKFLGKTVQMIPHMTDVIKEFITADEENWDFIIVEIGGTVGDIEGECFLEAIKQMHGELGPDRTMFIHLTYIPFIATTQELKTKPSQNTVKDLCRSGIQPNVLVCRTEHHLERHHINKLAQFTGVHKRAIIEAIDLPTVYRVPYEYYNQGLHQVIVNHFRLNAPSTIPNNWFEISWSFDNLHPTPIKIGIVGKYTSLSDSYISIVEALKHSGLKYNKAIEIVYINARDEKIDLFEMLSNVNGVIVPGGFGSDGIEGKINAIRLCRENNIPFLGICFGMQLAVIEFARNILNITNASSSEFDIPDSTNIVGLVTEWTQNADQTTKTIKRNKKSNLGGTMRLGSYPVILKPDSLAYSLYETEIIHERHRHRYEVNVTFQEKFEENGMNFSGLSEDNLFEIIEIPEHKFFIASQFHPEFKSRINVSRPLFDGLIKCTF
jgi:CTP synthase